MFRNKGLWRTAAVLTAAAIVASCTENNNDLLGPKPTGANSIFQNYVSLGNSITAGYQSGGINDSTQRRAYPVLLAQQMGVAFRYPALAGRGCAPPVNNFSTQGRVGTGSTSTTCDLRAATTTDLINNVAVPGAAVADLTDADGTANSNTLTSLFLSGKSQVQKALDNDPTFASIWSGNIDVLVPAVSGVLVPVAGVSPGITSQSAFEASYNAATDALTSGAPGLKGILIGVGKVSNIPLFFPAAALLPATAANPAFVGFQAATGYNASGTAGQQAPLTVDANCTGSASLVSFRLASQIALYRSNPSAVGAHPPHVACSAPATLAPYNAAPFTLVGEIFILTSAEQATLASAVTAYNTFISAEANSLGFAYMDPNVLLDSLRAVPGQIPTFPNLASNTATFGAWFSLDGVHPSSQAHRAITNHAINAINAKYSTSLSRISVP